MRGNNNANMQQMEEPQQEEFLLLSQDMQVQGARSSKKGNAP